MKHKYIWYSARKVKIPGTGNNHKMSIVQQGPRNVGLKVPVLSNETEVGQKLYQSNCTDKLCCRQVSFSFVNEHHHEMSINFFQRLRTF